MTTYGDFFFGMTSSRAATPYVPALPPEPAPILLTNTERRPSPSDAQTLAAMVPWEHPVLARAVRRVDQLLETEGPPDPVTAICVASYTLALLYLPLSTPLPPWFVGLLLAYEITVRCAIK
ncbi:MAG: hypothetical protein HY073_02215 [Deltaproteobacteria bacterium]|nr:hypothetical protein [Deltaproteobacteria bacterium]